MMIMIMTTMMIMKVMTIMVNYFCEVADCFYVSITSTQLAFTCSKSTMKAPEQCVESVQS